MFFVDVWGDDKHLKLCRGPRWRGFKTECMKRSWQGFCACLADRLHVHVATPHRNQPEPLVKSTGHARKTLDSRVIDGRCIGMRDDGGSRKNRSGTCKNDLGNLDEE
ncbi:MAG: hypothetical protein H7244_07325 [Herminiimonas sp.]|nr:hypothetical protein [Herminiimonas sp.]